jgi:Ca2+-binding EF-hand superfamily protein
MVNALLGAGPQNDDPIYLEAGKKMVRALDYTGDGGIDEDEFVSWVTTGMTRTGDERAQFSKRGPVNVLLLRLLDAITDECLNQKITLGEVNKEKKKILIKKKAKDSEARSATNVSSEKGAVDVDDGFALGEIQEMSFGSGMTIAAGGGSFTGKSKKQSLIDIFSKYDIKNTGNMDPDTFKRMCIDMLTSATTISEEDVRKFNDANDIKVVISALDMDGDGAIQKDEFVSWIISGINRSKESRIKFAEKNQLNSRLEMFLSAVEENISKDK